MPAARAASAVPQIGPAPAWVKPIAPDLAAEAAADELRQGTLYLLSDHQLRVDGADKQNYRHLAMKAVNEKGVEGIANLEIRFDPSFQTLTLHAITLHRGGRAMPKLSAGAVRVLQRERDLDEQLIFDGSRTAHVFLDDVRVGDVVEYSYTLQGSNPVFGGRHFGQFDLQWASPVHQLYARLLWPQGRPLHLLRVNDSGPATAPSERGGFVEHEWQRSRVAALNVSSEAPAWYDPYPAVQWGEFKDWAAVAQWALPLYRVPAALEGELKAEVARIAAAHASPQERAAEALRYVQKTVRYLGVEVGAGSHAPSAPALVLARRFGDCKDKTLLTVTMLRALGVEAWPALVNSQTRRGVAARQPSPGAFNHVIVRARIGERDYWLDPTKAPQPGALDTLSQSNFHQALVVDAASAGLTPMPLTEAMLNRRQIRNVFDASAGLDQPVRYTVSTVMQGSSAEAMRNQLAGSSTQELQKNYLNYYAKSYASITLDKPFVVQDEPGQNRLTLTEHYLIGDFWGEAEDRSKQLEANIRMPDMRSYFNAPQSAIRKEPLGLNHPVEVEQLTEVRLPEDWSLSTKGTKVEDPAFEFERTILAAPRLLTLKDRYRSRADEVSAADMPRFIANQDRARDALGYQFTKQLGPVVSFGWVDRFNWSLALLALGFAALWSRLARRVHRDGWRVLPARQTDDPGEPIGGWLMLLGLGVVCTPFVLAKNLWPSLPAFGNAGWSALTVPGGENYHWLMAPLLLYEMALNIGMLVFSVLQLTLFLQRRREFPRLYKIFGASVIVITALDLLACSLMPALAENVTARDWGRLTGGVLVLGLWWAYLNQSRRVRETFVRGPQAKGLLAEEREDKGQSSSAPAASTATPTSAPALT